MLQSGVLFLRNRIFLNSIWNFKLNVLLQKYSELFVWFFIYIFLIAANMTAVYYSKSYNHPIYGFQLNLSRREWLCVWLIQNRFVQFRRQYSLSLFSSSGWQVAEMQSIPFYYLNRIAITPKVNNIKEICSTQKIA